MVWYDLTKYKNKGWWKIGSSFPPARIMDLAMTALLRPLKKPKLTVRSSVLIKTILNFIADPMISQEWLIYGLKNARLDRGKKD